MACLCGTVKKWTNYLMLFDWQPSVCPTGPHALFILLVHVAGRGQEVMSVVFTLLLSLISTDDVCLHEWLPAAILILAAGHKNATLALALTKWLDPGASCRFHPSLSPCGLNDASVQAILDPGQTGCMCTSVKWDHWGKDRWREGEGEGCVTELPESDLDLDLHFDVLLATHRWSQLRSVE